MERFDVHKANTDIGWRTVKRGDGQGMFVYAEEALQYKSSYYMTLIFNALLALGCAVLAGYIVFRMHDPVPVQKVSEEEYRQAVQLAERKESEKATLRKQLADEHARRILGDKMLQAANANSAKLVKQLEGLQVSVPPLPIILKSVVKESLTTEGLQAAVTRNFGSEIAGRVRVVQ